MKISGSLLRPIVDITADGDCCIDAKGEASVQVPPIKAEVSKIPVGIEGAVTVPEIAVNVDPVPVSMTATVEPIPVVFDIPAISGAATIESIVFGIHVGTFNVTANMNPFTMKGHVGPIGMGAGGTLGGINGAAQVKEPIAIKANGSMGGFTADARLEKPITMSLDACVKGAARLNPENLQVPRCCEGYKPVACSCHIHKDHAYCDERCRCSPPA